MKEKNISYPVTILADAFPQIAIVRDTFEMICSISDRILVDKLNHFFEKQDIGFTERIAWSSSFSRESKDYTKNIKRLIHVIDSTNEEEKIDIYANLMRALLLEKLDLKMFWRLCDLSQKMYIGDIETLKQFIAKEITPQKIPNILVLQYNYLLVVTNEFTWGAAAGNLEYAPTKIGLELIRCGYDFDNYPLYDECLTAERVCPDK